MKRTRSTVSLLLILSMLLSVLPGTAAAEINEITTEPITEALPVSEETAVTETAPDAELSIIHEDVSLRGAYEKHFLMSDGSYQVTLYNEPVHQQENGEWVEIDNTLSLQTAADGTARYATANGLADVSFSQSVSDQLVTMQQGDYSVSWGVQAVSNGLSTMSTMSVEPVQAELVTSDLSTFSAEEQKTLVEKSSSTIQYRNALRQDVDLEYIVLPSRVKENIILQSPQDISYYVVTVYTENLTARLLENRRIEFYNDSDEVIFTMSSPYMYDSGAELSEDITVEMIEKGDGCYFIKMTPDAQWLNDESRVYPVVIDPEVSTDTTQQNIIDNYVLEGSGVQNYNLDRLYIGIKSGCHARAFIKYANMPTIPSGSTITAATMTVQILAGTSTANTANAYMVTSADWSSSTITWDNQPTAGVLLQSNISHNSKTKYSFSCLKAVQTWYSGSTTGQNKNYGVMMLYWDQDINDYNSFYSADHTEASQRPAIKITYQTPNNIVSVPEGLSYTLTPPSDSDTITWTSNNTAVATVNSSGKVTAIKAGTVTISASVDGVVQETYTVYVRIADGVYYIKNTGSGYYLSAKDGSIAAGTTVSQASKSSSTSNGLWQIWKITYLGHGKYSLRPMHNLRLGLNRPANVILSEIGLSDTYSSLVSHAMWTIRYDATGYVFENDGLSNYALRSPNFSEGTTVSASAYTQGSLQRWTLEKTNRNSDLLLYVLDTESLANAPRRGVAPGQTCSLTDINLTYAFSSTLTNNQTVTWSSAHTNVATVNSSTGAITGVTVGTTTITCMAMLNGNSYTEAFTLVVSEIPISGSELEYEPSVWNYDPVQGKTNCYAYAFNNQTLPGTNTLCYMQPGQFADLDLRTVPLNAANVIAYVEADAAAQGFIFEAIDKYDCCPTGSYKVALVIAPDDDFHWYRQNPDGTWSHKLAWLPVTDLDASNIIITNPETANRTYSNNYTVFAGYYCVTPMNNMYNSSSSAQISNSTPDTTLSGIAESTLSVVDANSIVSGMAYDEVVARIGEPDCYRTSSFRIAEYTLSNGNVLVIEFTDQNGQCVVQSCKIEGGYRE